jgi:hypothetical protein
VLRRLDQFGALLDDLTQKRQRGTQGIDVSLFTPLGAGKKAQDLGDV